MITFLEHNVLLRIDWMPFVPQFEVEVRSCTERSAVANQGDGLASLHAVAFFLEQRATVLVDRNEILIVLHASQITGFKVSSRATVSESSVCTLSIGTFPLKMSCMFMM